MKKENHQRGRPRRESLEIARTALWYRRVRDVSGWSEYRLELTFDEAGRAGRGLRKGTRWNKYKFGKASPGRQLLERVETAFPGTLFAYDHPIWTLAVERLLPSTELRRLVGLLPPEIADLLVDPDSPPTSVFWMRPELDHRAVISSLRSIVRERGIGHFGAVAGLLALIHDATNRQLDQQHFDCHVALADAAARAYGKVDEAAYAWRLEAYVFRHWVETEYRKPQMKGIVEEVRALESGPQVPWIPRQRILDLGQPNVHRNTEKEQDARGYWAAETLAAKAMKFGLSGGGDLDQCQVAKNTVPAELACGRL